MKATFNKDLITIELEKGDDPVTHLGDIMELTFPGNDYWSVCHEFMIITNDTPFGYDDEDKLEFGFSNDTMPQDYIFPDAKFWCPKNPKTALSELNQIGKLTFYPFEFIIIDELPVRIFKSDEDVYDPFTIVLCNRLARKKAHYDPYFDYVFSSSEMGSYSFLGEIGYDSENHCKGSYEYNHGFGREINGKDLDKFKSEYPELFNTIQYLVKENLIV